MHDKQHFFQTNLHNGITHLHHEMDVPFAEARIIIPVGNAHSHSSVPGGAPGIAHFLEHMCFERSARYPERNSFERAVSAGGGRVNAWTSAYYTDYYLEAPTNTFEELYQGLLSAVFEPILSPEDIQRQAGIIKNERAQRPYYPGDTELTQYCGTKWMRHAYYPITQLFGDDATLDTLSAEQLLQFQRYYTTTGLTVISGGNVPAYVITEPLTGLTLTEHQLTPVVTPTGWVNRTFHETTTKDIETPLYLWGNITPSFDLHQVWATGLIIELLTNHETGAINNWLRQESGLTYGVNFGMWHDLDRQGWVVEIPLPDRAVIAAVRDEIFERAHTALASQEQLESIKRRTELRACFDYQTLSDRMNRAVEIFTSAGRIPSEAEYFAWLSGVSTDRLQAVFESFFAQEQAGELAAYPRIEP